MTNQRKRIGMIVLTVIILDAFGFVNGDGDTIVSLTLIIGSA